ncbi:MAG: hypothetical protein ABIK92_00550 [Pseudomonadota bacterium]
MNEGIVDIVVTGELSADDVDKLRSKVIEIIRESNAKGVLTDVRASTGPHKIVDEYYRVRSLPSDVRIMPSAVVDVPENQDYKSFFETTAANSGWRIKWFTDIESAKK